VFPGEIVGIAGVEGNGQRAGDVMPVCWHRLRKGRGRWSPRAWSAGAMARRGRDRARSPSLRMRARLQRRREHLPRRSQPGRPLRPDGPR
jgi:hypothetical protein